jgi:hypothetical protein
VFVVTELCNVIGSLEKSVIHFEDWDTPKKARPNLKKQADMFVTRIEATQPNPKRKRQDEVTEALLALKVRNARRLPSLPTHGLCHATGCIAQRHRRCR